MRRKPDDSVRITTAASPRSDELKTRQRRYLISMAVRTVCFIATVVSIGHWYAWVFLAGAIVLPYVAVVMANAGAQPDIGDDDFVYRPDVQAIEGPSAQQPVSPGPVYGPGGDTTAAEAATEPAPEVSRTGRPAPDTGSQAYSSPAAEDRLTCSAKGCQNPALWALLWNNPKIHDPDRRKAWLACADHRQPLSEFLSARGFLREVRDL